MSETSFAESFQPFPYASATLAWSEQAVQVQGLDDHALIETEVTQTRRFAFFQRITVDRCDGRARTELELVERDNQANAIALNQVALNASRVAGPALGGALVAWPAVGTAGAFVLMGVCYGGAVLLQGGLPRPVPVPVTGPSTRYAAPAR